MQQHSYLVLYEFEASSGFVNLYRGGRSILFFLPTMDLFSALKYEEKY